MRRAVTAALACAALAIPASAVADHGKGHGKSHGKGKSDVAKQCAAQKKADKAAFKAMYGKHAMRKCIKKEALGVEDAEDVENAAKQCRAERNDDPEAFKEKWGTNAPNAKSKGAKRNAFGKCVAKTAKHAGEDDPPTPE